jgi:enamine deaminase RidA (YjgF/YER057c/UK114 family)
MPVGRLVVAMNSPNSPLNPKILRSRKPGLELTEVSQGSARELHLSLSPLPGESLFSIFQRLHLVLREHEAAIVKLDVFAPVEDYPAAMQAMQKTFGKTAWPVTWLDGASCAESPCIQVLAVAGASVEPVCMEGRVIGTLYQDTFARHFHLGDLRPAHPGESCSLQTSRTYELLENALALKGMSLFNITRTWFFLREILSWYDDFNAVRTAFYHQRKLIDRFVPASTGIGAKNPFGTALVLSAWAVEPISHQTQINMLPSPLQCPAPAYGSCFSRAAEIVTPGIRHVLVSGTASIHPPGESAHTGDMTAQVDLSMRVIAAILGTRKLTFADTTRATAYIKHLKDTPVFIQWLDQNQVPFPVHLVHADICRDELLFELELDAIARA